jgi:hypothetical protein
MSAFAGHGHVMQVNDDAFDADGSGGNSKEKGYTKKRFVTEQQQRTKQQK